MFTGIVEGVGSVTSVTEGEDSRELVIATPLGSELSLGQSIALDGACMTVTAFDAESFKVTAVTTTLQRTIAGRYAPGTVVNLERAARLGDRLDGHIVQGHVDGLGELVGVTPAGDAYLMDFRLPEEALPVTILHGSITLNGVSLTVNELREDGTCQVAIIPFTWEHTNLSGLAEGDPVNVEGDMIGKYVKRSTELRGSDRSSGGAARAD